MKGKFTYTLLFTLKLRKQLIFATIFILSMITIYTLEKYLPYSLICLIKGFEKYLESNKIQIISLQT